MQYDKKTLSERHFLDLLGDQLNKKVGLIGDRVINKPIHAGHLFQIPIVALFCSANWCPPCKNFIPILDRFQKVVNSKEY